MSETVMTDCGLRSRPTRRRRCSHERQHAAGKLTARERLELLFDPGACEIDAS